VLDNDSSAIETCGGTVVLTELTGMGFTSRASTSLGMRTLQREAHDTHAALTAIERPSLKRNAA
jgi:hypothetical protein